jgi:hypothetical protein
MKRFVVFLGILALAVAPHVASAQGFFDGSFLSSDFFNVGSIRVTPSVKVGYQRMGVNINLPVPFSFQGGLALATASELDFILKDAGVWIGGVRVDARRNGCSLFLTAEGNAIKSARVLTPSEPFFAGGFGPVDWRGSKLEWWSVGGGGAVDICGGVAVLGGVRAEQLSLGLGDPVDPLGVLQFFQAQFGDRYSSDLLTKLSIPYFGLRLEGLNFSSTLIFSPYTWANVKIPFRYLYVIPADLVYDFEEAQYGFKRGGIFLEGTFDYSVQATANAACTLWFKGNWCHIRGRGSEDYQQDVTQFGVPVFSFSDSADSANGTFGSYVLAGGLSFLWQF